MEGQGENGPGDVRPAVAAGIVLLLVTLIGVAVLNNGSSADLANPAPGRCLSRWNEDTKALRYGSHNFIAHRYTGAEVLYVDRAGRVARHGSCAVVFPAVSLDPEPVAAAKVYLDGAWMPMSKVADVSAAHLAELQARAIRRVNAVLHGDGTLDALS